MGNFSFQYRELYFEGGVSSVYLWDLDAGFAGVILIKKAGDGSKKIKGKQIVYHASKFSVYQCKYSKMFAKF